MNKQKEPLLKIEPHIGAYEFIQQCRAEFDVVMERLAKCNVVLGEPVLLRFNDRMRSVAGTAECDSRVINLNYRLHRQNPEELLSTFVHELAHILTYDVYRLTDHGIEWQSMMQRCGYSPEQYHEMETSQLKAKRRKWKADCECQVHEIGAKKRKNILSGWVYRCITCKSELVLKKEENNILAALGG